MTGAPFAAVSEPAAAPALGLAIPPALLTCADEAIEPEGTKRIQRTEGSDLRCLGQSAVALASVREAHAGDSQRQTRDDSNSRGRCDGFLIWFVGRIRFCGVRGSDLCRSDHRRQLGQTARPARAEMESSAGERYKRDELDRDRDRRIALAGRVHLGVHDALWRQIPG